MKIPSPPDSVGDWPFVGKRVYEFWSQASLNLEAAFRQVAPHLKPLTGAILGFSGSAGTGTLKFLASVVITGFLLPSGPRLADATRKMLVKITPERRTDFLALAGATIRTVTQGVIGVAVLQSLLAGIGLKIAGVPMPACLPSPFLCWRLCRSDRRLFLPVDVWIWTAKDPGTAALITIYLVTVGVSDNVLKPMLMGRGLSTPVLVHLHQHDERHARPCGCRRYPYRPDHPQQLPQN